MAIRQRRSGIRRSAEMSGAPQPPLASAATGAIDYTQQPYMPPNTAAARRQWAIPGLSRCVDQTGRLHQ